VEAARLNRRTVLQALAIAVATVARSTTAAQSTRTPAVGLLMLTLGPDDPLIQALRRGLLELGYAEGRNVRFEFRTASGHLDRIPALADELVKLGVDVIVAAPDTSALAAARQITSVPLVVMMFTTDPVEARVVKSFGKPGTNVTGLYGRQSEIVAKRLQLLKEALPDLSRVGALYDAPSASRLADLAVGAKALRIATVPIELKPPYDLVGAVEQARRAKVEALILLDSVPVYFRRKELAQLALKAKLPAIAQFHQFAEVGGFMSYGNDPQAVFARAAYFVDRILQGAKPAELPVEQMINFKLAVNLGTARILGVTVPASILARADQVIQ